MTRGERLAEAEQWVEHHLPIRHPDMLPGASRPREPQSDPLSRLGSTVRALFGRSWG